MEETAMPQGQARIEPGHRTRQEHKRKPLWKKYIWGICSSFRPLRSLSSFVGTDLERDLYSFFHIDFVKGNTFVGFDNYAKVLSNPDLSLSVRNTLYFMLLTLVIGFWVPIAASIAISELKLFQGFARIAAYLPFVVPGVVLYGMWRWMYDPVGPINALFGFWGRTDILYFG